MPESSFTHPLFGPVRFRTASLEWKQGDKITFLSGFDLSEMAPVSIPQLKNVPGSTGGKLKFHKRGHKQLLKAFEQVEARVCFITSEPALGRSTSVYANRQSGRSASFHQIMRSESQSI